MQYFSMITVKMENYMQSDQHNGCRQKTYVSNQSNQGRGIARWIKMFKSHGMKMQCRITVGEAFFAQKFVKKYCFYFFKVLAIERPTNIQMKFSIRQKINSATSKTWSYIQKLLGNLDHLEENLISTSEITDRFCSEMNDKQLSIAVALLQISNGNLGKIFTSFFTLFKLNNNKL